MLLRFMPTAMAVSSPYRGVDHVGQPRRDAAVRQLISALPQQPVIDVAVVVAHLPTSAVSCACESDHTVLRAEARGEDRPCGKVRDR